MKVKCPKCRYPYDFRSSIREEALLEVIRMHDQFHPQSRLVWEYVELFDTTRPIKALKLHRILSEVRDLWVSGRFSYGKRVYQISQTGIVDALKIMCNKHFETPLQNHNYLKKVMIPIAIDEVEKALQKKEEKLRSGDLRPGETVRVGRKMPERVKEIIEKL